MNIQVTCVATKIIITNFNCYLKNPMSAFNIYIKSLNQKLETKRKKIRNMNFLKDRHFFSFLGKQTHQQCLLRKSVTCNQPNTSPVAIC